MIDNYLAFLPRIWTRVPRYVGSNFTLTLVLLSVLSLSSTLIALNNAQYSGIVLNLAAAIIYCGKWLFGHSQQAKVWTMAAYVLFSTQMKRLAASTFISSDW